MRREEILQAATGLPVDEIVEAAQYRQITNYPAQDEVWAIIGIDKRRVIVRDSQPVGPDVASSATTVTVHAFMHLYCVEEHRNEGHEESLILSALEEAATHRLVPYVAVFANQDNAELWMKAGFRHPPWSPDGFLVYELTDEPWPDGGVDPHTRW